MAVGLNARLGAAPGMRRRVALSALALCVLLLHAWVTKDLAERLVDLDQDKSIPARMEVTYVREMALSAPAPTAAPAAPPPVVHRARPPRIARPTKPASAPDLAAPDLAAPVLAAPVLAAASMPEPTSEPIAESASERAPDIQVEPLAEVALHAAPASAPAAAPASATASAPASFEWPASTRMRYALTGNYRGEVSGSAQVEWIRAGSHYQVHLDLVVGPSFAPVITRRMSSDGEITADGLVPHRYDQDTKVVLRERNRVAITFEPGTVVLANGDRRNSVPGVQDTASQFVQLTYVFNTRPELLRIGGTVDIPLALPHKVDVWTYDVVGEETLYTAFGPLPSIHLTPRRDAPKPGDLSAEIWFAPQLRYLPVRIRISQDEGTYLDLLIDKQPEMGVP
jgi:hypothetical protein